jgi:hypothetical protein
MMIYLFNSGYFLIAVLLIVWLALLSYYVYGMAQRQFQSRGKKMKKSWLQYLVRDRKLTPRERLASRIGYMGAGFLIAAQWTIEPALYILGFLCVLVQVVVRKQWNLVALNVNGLFAWLKHLFFQN